MLWTQAISNAFMIDPTLAILYGFGTASFVGGLTTAVRRYLTMRWTLTREEK